MSRPHALPLAAALLLGCGATFHGVDRTAQVGGARFQLGPLPEPWARAGVPGGRVAFHHPNGGSISASAECDRPSDAPLDVLTDHLLIGLEPRRVTHRAPLTLDGRAALYSEVRTALDGVPVTIDLLVLKKDGCIYDFQLVATPERMASLRGDFDLFWGGFRLLASR